MERYIREKYQPDILMSVNNAWDCKEILSKMSPFDVLFLDHDLGNQVYVDSYEENTGYQVARHIAGNSISFTDCYIHSMNEFGAKLMLELLKPVGNTCWIPFPDLEGMEDYIEDYYS